MACCGDTIIKCQIFPPEYSTMVHSMRTVIWLMVLEQFTMLQTLLSLESSNLPSNINLKKKKTMHVNKVKMFFKAVYCLGQ